jgi:PAS domain S-box-containing protein
MNEQDTHPGEEIKCLQRCINDLVSLLALPALWSGGDASQIARTLMDVLQRLLQLDLIYVQLNDPLSGAPAELARVAQSPVTPSQSREIGAELHARLGDDPQKWPSRARFVFRDRDINIAPLRLGLQGEIGMVVAGAARSDFPKQTEELLLTVATNQAVMALHEARRRIEQMRLAEGLDHRVEERTAELAAANEQLKLQVGLLQLIPVAAWTIRPDGTPDSVNHKWLEYTGQTLDYVISEPEAWMAAVHSEDRKDTAAAFWKGIRSQRDFTMEARFRRAQDGAYRWHLNRAVALRDADGKIIKFVGTSTDIEDLKQSQQELRKTEERTRLIIDTALDAVVTMDASGMITSWNKQAETIFGWNSTEAIGRRMSELIIPFPQRTAHERGLRHFLATGEGPLLSRRIEVTAIRCGGVEFPVELEVIPMKLGGDWNFSAFIRDITESKRAEEKLRESELNLRQMTETIPEMLWSATADGAIDYCNTRLLDYTGYSAHDVMGKGWTKLIHPDDVESAARTWMSCVASGAAYRVEVRAIHALDRTYRWCVMNARPLLDQDGRILKWHGTVVDMHDWKQSQEALRNTQAELANMARVMTLGQLTASIAHEVNQPLSGIITNASTCLRMLDADPPNIDGARETARRTIRDGNRASEVIARLRALFSKRQAATEPVDLNEAAREVIALLLSKLQRNNVSLRSELADDLPLVTGDRVQLQQVIMNLLQNASDAMNNVHDRARQLLIQTQQDDADLVRLTVQDSGIGLDPQTVSRLFDPFYTSKNNGMGIGLSVSRSIIENHGGKIWAKPNDGPGAMFSFSIPRSPAGAVGERLPSPARRTATANTREIVGNRNG